MLPFDTRTTNKRLPEAHILHLACQYQAPLETIELLAKIFPKSVSTPENKDRYPIHIACAKGLKPSVINYLIKSYPEAAGVQDEYGKTPLHYVSESYEENFRIIPANVYRSPRNSMAKVVSMLLEKAPESANVEDSSGMNAIEYAIDSRTDVSIIKMMQNTSRDNWRIMQKVHRGKSHEELRHSITSLSSSINSMVLSSEMVNRLQVDQDDNRLAQEEKIDNINSHTTTIQIGMLERKVQVARTA